ncbi:CLUMA_CG001874, isoform A [Clunio marinus]|uniref:Replication protein A subunit n=1 Tax=Clunio marinus TaxID=568069 RepID=A0A1J1HPE8_9DIPT|nr:CLUMA_CG001874, isoform A [Clunio marinus]
MANKFTPLSTGCIKRILLGEELGSTPFVLQVIDSRRVNQQKSDLNRYRLLISDGVHIASFAMLAIDLNPIYESGQLSKNTIIRVTKHNCSVVSRGSVGSDRRVLVLMGIDILHSGEEVGSKIGNPDLYDPKGSTLNAAGTQKENYNDNAGASSYNNQSNAYQKRENSYGNQSMNASSSNLNEHLTMPIDSLSPYQNKWVIKARVTAKSQVRTWSNQKGEGKLFNFDICDESGEIRVTGFRDQVDKYYDMIEVDKVYYITKCQLKPANKQYSKLRNDYEMTMGNETVIQECDDLTHIPAIKYDFVSISDIAAKEAGAFVDVIAVCKEASDLVNLTSRAGKDLTKREVTLVDQSGASIVLTLWGEEAKNFQGYEQPVVLLKGAKIGEFGGGKTLGGNAMKLNPDIPEGHKLRGWVDNGGMEGEVKQLSMRTQGNFNTEWMTFHEAKLRNLGAGDKPDYYQVKGFIHNIRSSNAYYKACINTGCNKKVIDQENGTYRCEKCNVESSEFKYRLLVNMLVGDWTSNRWVTVFAEVAEELFGKTSQEIGTMLEFNKEEADAIFNDLAFQQKVFKLRTKVETYQDVPKNKVTVLSISEPNYKDYNKQLLANIQRLTGIHTNN